MITRKTYIITLTTKDPFRIGGKGDPLSASENPVALVGGRVCIPGSSLKGALRGELERFLNDNNYENQKKIWPTDRLALQPCIPATKLSPDEQRLVSEKRFRGTGCHYPCDIGPRAKCGQSPNDAHGICPVCYLLGAQGLVGFAQIPFLFTDVRYDELYSARLERTSHTVMSGTNRSFQLIPPDTKFTGILEILMGDSLLGWQLGGPRNLKDHTKGDAWLLGNHWSQDKISTDLITERLKAIRSLGGYRSKGFGNVEIMVE